MDDTSLASDGCCSRIIGATWRERPMCTFVRQLQLHARRELISIVGTKARSPIANGTQTKWNIPNALVKARMTQMILPTMPYSCKTCIQYRYFWEYLSIQHLLFTQRDPKQHNHSTLQQLQQRWGRVTGSSRFIRSSLKIEIGFWEEHADGVGLRSEGCKQCFREKKGREHVYHMPLLELTTLHAATTKTPRLNTINTIKSASSRGESISLITGPMQQYEPKKLSDTNEWPNGTSQAIKTFLW